MAFVNLQARSPRRFAFIESRKGALAPHLRAVSLPRRPPPRGDVGDFPEPTGPDRLA